MDTINDNKVDSHKKREYSEYEKVCGSITDPALLILRIHLYVEYLLERLVLCKLPRGDRLLESGNLSFHQKLHLVASFDYLDDSQISVMRELNRVRNSCAHELHKEITIADVDKIGRPFGKEYTRIRKERYGNVFATLSGVLASLCGGLAACTHLLEEKQLGEQKTKDREK